MGRIAGSTSAIMNPSIKKVYNQLQCESWLSVDILDQSVQIEYVTLTSLNSSKIRIRGRYVTSSAYEKIRETLQSANAS